MIDNRTPQEIDLFCEFIRHYYNEADAWKAVKIAIDNNMTAYEVMKIF